MAGPISLPLGQCLRKDRTTAIKHDGMLWYAFVNPGVRRRWLHRRRRSRVSSRFHWGNIMTIAISRRGLLQAGYGTATALGVSAIAGGLASVRAVAQPGNSQPKED